MRKSGTTYVNFTLSFFYLIGSRRVEDVHVAASTLDEILSVNHNSLHEFIETGVAARHSFGQRQQQLQGQRTKNVTRTIINM